MEHIIDLSMVDRLMHRPDLMNNLRKGFVKEDYGEMVSTVDGVPIDTPELRLWRGAAGTQYTFDNHLTVPVRGKFLEEVTRGLDYQSVLEVGCNVGHNLDWFSSQGKKAYGIDPIEGALLSSPWRGIVATAFALPFASRSFDLVLCAGVLCHIAPERLANALSEIERVCSKYAIVIDYPATVEEVLPFRGSQLMWRRDFCSEIKRRTWLSLLSDGITDKWDGSGKNLMYYTVWRKRDYRLMFSQRDGMGVATCQ